MDAEGLGRKLLLTRPATAGRPLRTRLWGTWQHLTKCSHLKALSNSLNAGTAQRGCLGRGKAFGWPSAVCPQNGCVHLHIIEICTPWLGMTAIWPTQTGLCKFGCVWSLLTFVGVLESQFQAYGQIRENKAETLKTPLLGSWFLNMSAKASIVVVELSATGRVWFQFTPRSDRNLVCQTGVLGSFHWFFEETAKHGVHQDFLSRNFLSRNPQKITRISGSAPIWRVLIQDDPQANITYQRRSLCVSSR